MSTEETRAKSFAISTILVGIVVVVCIVFFVYEALKTVPASENKTGRLEQVDTRFVEANKKNDTTEKLIMETEKLVTEVEKEIEKFKDDVKQLKKEIEELEHLMCEKGLLKDCKSI